MSPKKVIRKTASNVPRKKLKDQVQVLRTYDFELSNTGESLVLEEQMLDRLPTYFIEHRQGTKVKAIVSVSKKEFDIWAKNLDLALQKSGTANCDKAPKIKRTAKAAVTTKLLCEGSLSAPEREALNKVRSEVLVLMKKPSAQKAAH